MARRTPGQPHIVIIGAGVSGMSMAIALKEDLGFTNFTIIEKAAEVGGTWRDNIYPGSSSDVAVHFYSLSRDLKSDWTHSHAFQPELQEYWLKLAHKYDLYSNIIFNRTVLSAQWNPKEQRYNIVSEDSVGAHLILNADILVSAIGLLEVPKFPDIPGITRFKGDSFHSARWISDISLAGKHVAVIGSGPSATQFVPIISKDPSVNVTQFCRSRNWILPPVRREYSATQKWLLGHVPFYLRAFRNFSYIWSEILYFAIFSNTTTHSFVERNAKTYMTQTTPAEYVNQVVPVAPSHKVGCKRVVYDTNYLPSLARPNLSSVWDPIESISADGILTREGTRSSCSTEFDVIIYSTGYVTDQYPIYVKGSRGQTVAEYYEACGGPTAYLGTTIPGFPNFFWNVGPNTATGHTSLLFAIEVQIAYVIQMVKPVIAGDIVSLEVTAAAADAYNAKIQSRLAGYIWSKCFSWYRAGNTGKITGLFPGPMFLFWWWLRHPNWAHYKVLAVGQWEPRQPFWRKRNLTLVSAALGVGLVMACVGFESI
ncbi:hypothetical protein B0H10DRAFT_2303255 [Mycena sp. CBHHK59/15]|nr:hypothetical protein B0H10DRAFT_2303255 [Mycena sp. CBHHK59/15]